MQRKPNPYNPFDRLYRQEDNRWFSRLGRWFDELFMSAEERRIRDFKSSVYQMVRCQLATADLPTDDPRRLAAVSSAEALSQSPVLAEMNRDTARMQEAAELREDAADERARNRDRRKRNKAAMKALGYSWLDRLLLP